MAKYDLQVKSNAAAGRPSLILVAPHSEEVKRWHKTKLGICDPGKDRQPWVSVDQDAFELSTSIVRMGSVARIRWTI